MITLIPIAGYYYILVRTGNFEVTQSPEWIEYLSGIAQVLSRNYWMSVVLVIPIIYIAFSYIKRIFLTEEREEFRTAFSNSTLFLSILLIAIISAIISTTTFLGIPINTNDWLIILPPVFILAARGICLMTNKTNTRIIGGIILVVVMIAATYLSIPMLEKPNYNHTARFIKRQIEFNKINQYNTGIGFIKSDNIPLEAYQYYIRKADINLQQYQLDINGNIIGDIGDIEQIWIICDNGIVSPDVIKMLRCKYTLLNGFNDSGISLYLISTTPKN